MRRNNSKQPSSTFQADCRLLSTIPDWKPERMLSINSGVVIDRPTNWDRIHSPMFSLHEDSGRYLPKNDWRPLTFGEIDLATGVTDDDNLGETIQLFRIPHHLHRELQQGIQSLLESSELEKDDLGFVAIPKASAVSLVARVDVWLQSFVWSRTEWHNNGAGFVVREAGHASSTGWGGLHVDLWGPNLAKQVCQRYNGLRFVMNLGQAPRRFVFHNIRLSSMLRMHPYLLDVPPLSNARHQIMHDDYWQRLVGDLFIELAPAYPLVSVLMEPGDGYLAPTTTIFHDGCPSGTSAPDVTVRAGHSGFSIEPIGAWRAPAFRDEWLRMSGLKSA